MHCRAVKANMRRKAAAAKELLHSCTSSVDRQRVPGASSVVIRGVSAMSPCDNVDPNS